MFCLNPYCNGYGSVTYITSLRGAYDPRLNPYCNGYGSVTTMFVNDKPEALYVLILIVMDMGL